MRFSSKGAGPDDRRRSGFLGKLRDLSRFGRRLLNRSYIQEQSYQAVIEPLNPLGSVRRQAAAMLRHSSAVWSYSHSRTVVSRPPYITVSSFDWSVSR